MNKKEKSKYDWKAGDKARVKDGWALSGIIFEVLGPAIFVKQWWVPVKESGPEIDEPDFFKAAGLEKIETLPKKYVPISIRPLCRNETITKPRETAFAIGQCYDDRKESEAIGFWSGPHPSLTKMLEIVGRDSHSVIVRFNANWTDDIIYRWEDSDEPGWVRVEGDK